MSKHNITASELMADARAALSTNWGIAVGAGVIFVLITMLSNFIPAGLGNMIIGGPLALGLAIFHSKIARGNTVAISDLFDGFNDFGRSLIAYLVIVLIFIPVIVLGGLIGGLSVYIFMGSGLDFDNVNNPLAFAPLLGLLMLVILPIVTYIQLGLSQTMYLLMDNKEISGVDAVKESWRMMKGNKMRLFTLWLHFLPWAFLSIFTLGLGFFFLMPYIGVTSAKFYDAISEADIRADMDLSEHIVE